MSLETQSANVVLKPGELLKPEELRKAVKAADFTAGVIRVKATGEVAANPAKATAELADLRFIIPDTKQTFLLIAQPPPVDSEKSEKPELKDLLPKLREAFKSGKKRVTLTGQVHQHKELPAALTVQAFEIAG